MDLTTWTGRKLAGALALALLACVALLLVRFTGGSDAASHPKAHASGSITYKQKTFSISGANAKRRLVVRCPGRLVPLGGGMTSSPLPAADGEGIYPHSYERLGVQHGYHSTVVLFDPSPSSTESRNVTLQVACARKQRHVTPPHKTVYVSPGQTKTAVATCPGRRHLFGGGFQRTDFTARGGDYITESRAISDKSWSVTGRAFGQFGGELTAIAYCWRSKKPLLTEVASSPTTVGQGRFATATTPPCPVGRLVFGGFSSSPAGSILLTNGVINGDGSWSASGMNHFGPSGSITAYGYCLKL
jgi:hypothetical protein